MHPITTHPMRVKRPKLILLLLLSFLLIGCGIPNYFYLGSSYYRISSVSPPSSNSSDVSIKFNDPQQIAKCTNDNPSAVIFYWIDNQNSPSGSGQSGLISAFSTALGISSSNPGSGVPLTIYTDAQSSPVAEYKYLVNSSSDNKKNKKYYIPYSLYYASMKDTNGNNVRLQSPTFHVPPIVNAEGKTVVNFTIKMDDEKYLTDGVTSNENFKKIYLEYTDKTGVNQKYELTRYDTASFSQIPTKEDLDNGYADYSIFTAKNDSEQSMVEFNQNEIYVHFAVAFCASKGNFNNIFWSTLTPISPVFKIGRDTST